MGSSNCVLRKKIRAPARPAWGFFGREGGFQHHSSIPGGSAGAANYAAPYPMRMGIVLQLQGESRFFTSKILAAPQAQRLRNAPP